MQRVIETGTIIKWFGAKGYGFIQPQHGTENLFCHITAIYGREEPQIGTVVQYSIVTDDKSGRPRASRVEVLSEPGA